MWKSIKQFFFWLFNIATQEEVLQQKVKDKRREVERWENSYEKVDGRTRKGKAVKKTLKNRREELKDLETELIEYEQ